MDQSPKNGPCIMCMYRVHYVLITQHRDQLKGGMMGEVKVNKARKQLAIWVTTDDILNRLAKMADMSKSQIVHLAITKFAEEYLDDEEDPTNE